MKLKNILLAVSDMERSKEFYKTLFGLEVIADYDGNAVLTEGLVLQDAAVWKALIGKDIETGSHGYELYFEENDMDDFLEKLKKYPEELPYAHPLMEHPWGQRVVRLYDPDMHLIEVGESMDFVARRFLKQGMSAEEVAWKTQMALARVEELE